MERILIIAALAILTACSPRVIYVPVEKTRTVTEVKHDTIVTAALPEEQDSVRVADTTAIAETSLAKAVASYNGAAQELTLKLENKRTDIPVRVEYVERIIRDSIPYPVEVIKEVPVYKSPWYTRALIGVTIISAVVALALAAWAFIRR